MTRSSVLWLPQGWFTSEVGLCPSLSAWRKLSKTDGLQLDDDGYHDGDGATHLIDDNKGGKIILVTLNDRYYRRDRKTIDLATALLVHESVHVWQYMLEVAGERSRPREIEAHSIEWIFSELYINYSRAIK